MALDPNDFRPHDLNCGSKLLSPTTTLLSDSHSAACLFHTCATTCFTSPSLSRRDSSSRVASSLLRFVCHQTSNQRASDQTVVCVVRPCRMRRWTRRAHMSRAIDRSAPKVLSSQRSREHAYTSMQARTPHAHNTPRLSASHFIQKRVAFLSVQSHFTNQRQWSSGQLH